MLTPKEIRGQGAAKVFPHEIENSALIESSYTIPGTVATDATISLCFKPTAAKVAIMIDGSAHHHLVIQKTGTTVTLWKNGKDLPDYTGTVGANYGDLLKDVLTALSGSSYGYYSELHVVEQSLEPSIFGEFTDLVTGLWVLKVFIVPTSIHDLGNIATSGVATAKSMQSGYLPSRLNDGLYADNTTLWQSGIGDVTNVWVEIDFGATHEIEQYGMVGNQYSSIITRAPKTWVTELYVDGEWVTVDTQTNVVAWGVGAKRDYALGARYSASKIRVTVNSNQGDTQNTTIGELFVYAVEDITYGDGGGYYNFANALKLGEEFAQGKTVKDYGDNKLVSGTPSGTTGYVSWTIEKAFDGSKSTAHAIALGSHPYANGVYTQYKVGTVFIPGKYLIASSGMSGTSYTSWVKAWEFQATNDNWATYDVLDAQSGQTFGNKVSREYVITPGSTAYTDFRIKHLASNHVNYTDVAEFKVWAAPQMVSPNDATITGTQTVDTMTDTQPTWDRLLPAFYSGGSMTYSNGNRTVAYVLNNATALTTPIPVNGKWAARMEWAVAANKNNTFCGICDDEYLHSSGEIGRAHV